MGWFNLHRGTLFTGTSGGSGEVHKQFGCVIAADDFAALATATFAAIAQVTALAASTGSGCLRGGWGNSTTASSSLVGLVNESGGRQTAGRRMLLEVDRKLGDLIEHALELGALLAVLECLVHNQGYNHSCLSLWWQVVLPHLLPGCFHEAGSPRELTIRASIGVLHHYFDVV